MSDSDRFDDFYRATRRRLLACVYLLVGDAAEAQDITQEAFVRAWQRWSTVGGYADPESWVRLVACRLAVSRWRSLRRRSVAYGRIGEPPPAPPPGTERPDLVSALRQLPPALRLTVTLHYLIGMSVLDVARHTGVPEGTVKARLWRARKALAELLGPYAVEDSHV